MLKDRFDMILQNLHHTDRPRPSYRDRLHNVRQLLGAWNDNCCAKFTPGWISCIDESISAWLSRWTCPGWMFVPQKPWRMGNKYHTVCCGLSGIMWKILLDEEKDAPSPRLCPPKYPSVGKTVALLMEWW
jgi:hypothetical protein